MGISIKMQLPVDGCFNCGAYAGRNQSELRKRLVWDGQEWVCKKCYKLQEGENLPAVESIRYSTKQYFDSLAKIWDLELDGKLPSGVFDATLGIIRQYEQQQQRHKQC